MTDTSKRIYQLRIFPDQLTALVDPLTTEQRITPYLAHEWTVAQNVHHLAESHMHAYLRCKRMLMEDNPLHQPYEQDDWANHPAAMLADLTAPLTLLRGLHHTWANLFDSLTDDQWLRTGRHPEHEKQLTPLAILEIYSAHGPGHIDQIQRTLAAQPK